VASGKIRFLRRGQGDIENSTSEWSEYKGGGALLISIKGNVYLAEN
jgi:hypothetical protein